MTICWFDHHFTESTCIVWLNIALSTDSDALVTNNITRSMLIEQYREVSWRKVEILVLSERSLEYGTVSQLPLPSSPFPYRHCSNIPFRYLASVFHLHMTYHIQLYSDI